MNKKNGLSKNIVYLLLEVECFMQALQATRK